MSLPDDLVREILSKLATSIKSAARLSCVCKSWREWIRHPDFLKPHPLMVICKPGGDPQITFHRRGSEYQILSTHDPDTVYPLHIPQVSWVRVIGECNGILCLLNLDDDNLDRHDLYNPITREYRKVPPPDPPCGSTNFDIRGFGFNKLENDYKIIRFGETESEDDIITNAAMIYKLSTNCWTILDVDLGFLDTNSSFSIACVCVNGSCYWLHKTPARKSLSIVSFDLQTETFGHITDAAPMTPYYKDEYMGVLDDSLAICCFNKVHRDVTEVWVMSEYRNMESCWTKKFTINSKLESNCCYWVYDANLFQISSKDGKVSTYLIHGEGDDQETSTRMFKANDNYRRSLVFKPSLASLQRG